MTITKTRKIGPKNQGVPQPLKDHELETLTGGARPPKSIIIVGG